MASPDRGTRHDEMVNSWYCGAEILAVEVIRAHHHVGASSCAWRARGDMAMRYGIMRHSCNGARRIRLIIVGRGTRVKQLPYKANGGRASRPARRRAANVFSAAVSESARLS